MSISYVRYVHISSSLMPPVTRGVGIGYSRYRREEAEAPTGCRACGAHVAGVERSLLAAEPRPFPWCHAPSAARPPLCSLAEKA